MVEGRPPDGEVAVRFRSASFWRVQVNNAKPEEDGLTVDGAWSNEVHPFFNDTIASTS